MSEAQHVLGPYEAFPAGPGQRAIVGVLTADRNIRVADVGDRQLSVDEINATAAFIARACNAHDKLVAAAAGAAFALNAAPCGCSQPGTGKGFVCSPCKAKAELAAALKKAEGGE